MFHSNSSQKSCHYTFYYRDKDSAKVIKLLRHIYKEIFVYKKLKIQGVKNAPHYMEHSSIKKINYENLSENEFNTQNYISVKNDNMRSDSQQNKQKTLWLKKNQH